ncbi:DUF3050 domain-containing protein [Myroides guanonis]|uniref:DUF3050 domain-containing protein n=1 Tax=Myroides guanonis TaxID=1150112 RepID=A0A1I3SE27_9FLAO|nr:DUF3050 domain-containing protein [Myroides guanonis]SFJ57083.1 Protein of unknown function [Myroides guanonis]
MTIQYINEQLAPERNQLLNHSLYQKVRTIADLHSFMEGHVYAVWDFMSLLKALQQRLTCTTTPWFASKNPETRYLINEIVLAEESDIDLEGNRLSHFEMYIDAMRTSNANTEDINIFLSTVLRTVSIFEAIEQSNLHPLIKEFLNFSFKIIEEGEPHKIAAAFTFGREDLIPDMFSEILKNLQLNFPESDLSKLVYYFQRHIDLDGDEHGPMAMKMISELCGEDNKKWNDVLQVSKEALIKRIGLWNAIEQHIDSQNKA